MVKRCTSDVCHQWLTVVLIVRSFPFLNVLAAVGSLYTKDERAVQASGLSSVRSIMDLWSALSDRTIFDNAYRLPPSGLLQYLSPKDPSCFAPLSQKGR
jgi:hypothetical protein